MPSPSDYTGPVRYSEDRTSVICRHCRAEIERGGDYSVLLYFPDDTEKRNPMGCYCSDCMSKLKVCCDCKQAYFGTDEIKYFQNGIYYCTDCAASKDICSFCGKTKDIRVVNGKKVCGGCYKDNYFECGKCKETHERGQDNKVSGTDLHKAQYANMFKRWGEVCDTCFSSLQPRYKAKKVYECLNCGRIHSLEGKYCKYCIDDLPKCHFCNEIIHEWNIVQNKSTGKTFTICKKCKYSTCDSCGTITQDKLNIKKGIFGVKSVCNSCLTGDKGECKSCLTYAKLYMEGMCMNCYDIFNEKCSNCGEIVIETDHGCRACISDYASVMCYSYKPKPLFHYTDKDVIEGDNIFMGFENELTCSSERAVLQKIYNSGLNHTKMNAKSDGSIRGTGFEMVSHPYTLRALKAEKIDPLFRDVKSHDSCGMHVHFDRRCLKSDTHLYKVISFIHENEKFSDAVAGRKFTSYQSKLEGKASSVVKKGSARRSQRVNLCNKATVEIRMFASADRKYKFMMRMEFVHALISYTRNASIKACKGYSGFIHYVAVNKRRYNNLHKFLSSPSRFWSK